MNNINQTLEELYDKWQCKLEEKQLTRNDFSSMFRMGVPNGFDNQTIIMFVGQECLRCYEYKTQDWIIKYQETQFYKQKIDGFNESVNSSPFWQFFRELSFNKEYYPIWNNLDKFHIIGNSCNDDKKIDKETAMLLNSPCFNEGDKTRCSILQKEISLIRPKIIIFAIGKQEKYIASLASAFSLDINKLTNYKPLKKEPVRDISDFIGIPNTKVFWTYHPRYLRTSKSFDYTLEYIKKNI